MGLPRSGTTLVAAILDRHSRICILPETHYYHWFLPRRELSAHNRWEGLVDELLEFKYCAPAALGVNRAALLAALPTDMPPVWPRAQAQLFAALLECYAAQEGKPLVGEKTPLHLFRLHTIIKDFPDAKVLWVTRDGRDVLLSTAELSTGLRQSLRVYAWRWREGIDYMLSFEKRHPNQVHRVNFETLLASPEAETRQLCNFLNVSFEQSQIDHQTPTGVVAQDEISWKFRVFKPFDRSRTGRWKSDFDEAHKWMLNSVMQDRHRAIGIVDEIGLEGCPLLQRARHGVANWLCQTHPRMYRYMHNRFFRRFSPRERQTD